MYTHTCIDKYKYTYTYIYIIFVNLVEVYMLVHTYFVDYSVICLGILGKCFRVSLECFFLSGVGHLLYFQLVLPFQYIIEMA